MPTIHKRIEQPRQCGFRKRGGLYFVSTGAASPCCKLPFLLHVCPTCGSGIKQARGFTWINSDLFCPPECDFKFRDERPDSPSTWKLPCIMSKPGQRIGLMWVGKEYYSVQSFSQEAALQGISKRIAQVPRDFKIGETWIALAHPRAVVTSAAVFDPTTYGPGIFYVFRPTAIEYIVIGNETELQLQALEERGFTLVDVVPAGLYQDYEKNNLLTKTENNGPATNEVD